MHIFIVVVVQGELEGLAYVLCSTNPERSTEYHRYTCKYMHLLIKEKRTVYVQPDRAYNNKKALKC